MDRLSFRTATFVAELKRRRVFRAALGYGVVAWGAMQAASLIVPALGLPTWIVRATVLGALAAFPVVLALAWWFEISRDGIRRTEQAGHTEAAALDTTRALWPRLALVPLVLLLLAGGAWMALRSARGSARVVYEQLTNFNDAALAPAVSADGRMVAFIRGPAMLGGSTAAGDIYAMLLPDGEPRRLTDQAGGKTVPAFSPDGTRIAYTRVEEGFTWNTWEVPVLGGTPNLLLANATGLNWISEDSIAFSEIRRGIHMALVTADEDRSNQRDLYVPPNETGMIHRSAVSPDRRSVLAVEMDGTAWLPCRLLRLDDSSRTRQVGPANSQCTWAAWSPDGKWMYFSAETTGGFHIWRQRFPDGEPRQLTFGVTEEEGVAPLPDGRSFITSVGTRHSTVWLSSPRGEEQISSQAFAFQPTFAPDSSAVYYLVRTAATAAVRTFAAGELWRTVLATRTEERVLPGVIVTHYALSYDGQRVAYTTAAASGPGGIWIADLRRRRPPRQLTFGNEDRVFFLKDGTIVYSTVTEPRQIYRMRADGSDQKRLRQEPILYILSVSPAGDRLIAARAVGRGDGVTRLTAYPLVEGGSAVDICTICVVGFGPGRRLAPPVAWSPDGKLLYVALRFFGASQKTLVLPASAADSSLSVTRIMSEQEFAAVPGARLIGASEVFPALDSASYLVVRQHAQANLYRVRLQ